MITHYRLRVIRLEALDWKPGWNSDTPNLYVEAELGSINAKTRAIKSRTPSWEESFPFHAPNDKANIKIKVRHKSRFSYHRRIAVAEVTIADLLLRSARAESVPLELSLTVRGSITTAARIFLCLEAIDTVPKAEAEVLLAVEDIEARFARSQRISGLVQSGEPDNQGDLYQAVGDLLERLKVFEGVMDVLSGIHPFFIIAWSAASSLQKAARATFDTDKKIMRLVTTMNDSIISIRDVQSLETKYTDLQKTINELLKQIADCCIFVRHYASLHFARRAVYVNSNRVKITEFEQALAHFRQRIDLHLSLETSHVSVRMGELVEYNHLKNALSPGEYNAFNRSKCLPETRVAVMTEILDWTFSEPKENVFWLYGVAGAGKSTISTTIASYLREMHCLGAFLFFERGKSEASSVIRTIAYRLALFDSNIREGVLSSLKEDQSISEANAEDQFRRLLREPLAKSANTTAGPIVIVLDALDECGSREKLMRIIEGEFRTLPNTVRFLITSRPEQDIHDAFSSEDFVFPMELDCTTEASRQDVLAYLHAEVPRLVRKNDNALKGWKWDEGIQSLADAAGGLFIWAATAVKMIESNNFKVRYLKQLVSRAKSLNLDELYKTALNTSGIIWGDEDSKECFRRALALVLLSKRPVTSDDINAILGLPSDMPSADIFQCLRSVLAYEAGRPVRLLHASFSDYLLSPNRSNDPWFIDLNEANSQIASGCFAVMEDLRFNMCRLESSFVRNDDIPGLEDRVRKCIPTHQEYACIHWAQHLRDAQYSDDLREKLIDFAHRRLLFWFEVLSLVKMFGRVASRALLEAASWCEDSDVAFFLRDASKLATIFALPIMQSMPHIYVTMIPLSMDDSSVARRYSRHMSSLVGVERKGARRSLLCLKILEGNFWVNSVAFSPSGRQIASASGDETVRVWDIDSGEEVIIPTGAVTSVCFSPDGNRIVSGSYDHTVRIWDARSSNPILGPLEGRFAAGTVAWSPDGRVIASGAHDGMIVIWNAGDGNAIFRLEGHKEFVAYVAFSPDSTRVASGSCDYTIRIWDVINGKLASKPFKGHFLWVRSVAFSPDGQHVVSGSEDQTIKIWEVESGCVISTLIGHTDSVTSVVYLPCGTRVVSGSEDRTVRVWDAKSGKILSTLDGHTDIVTSISISPDGKHIASGSVDRTIRIWDATATTDNSLSSTRHSHFVASVAFSPDGNRIASASNDETIIVWDASSGRVALGPLIGHTNSVSSVVFSPDGLRLLSGSWDDTIRIWDAQTGCSVSDPLVHSDSVDCIAVSPGGATVVSGCSNGTINVWGVADGQSVSVQRHSHRVRSITFSPNGERLAIGSGESIIVWNTKTWEAMYAPLTGHTDDVFSVCFSSDSRWLVSGSEDSTIVIWDTDNGQKIAGPLKGHKGSVVSVLFSLDGRYIISGSWDTTIRIWNVKRGQAIRALGRHTDGILCLALSPDGRRILSGSYDTVIRVWDISDLLSSEDSDGCESQTIPRSSSSRSRDTQDWILGENGWILGGRDQTDLLLWIPPDLRATLWMPRNTAVMNCDFLTRLDFSGAALGEEWVDCFTAAEQSQQPHI